MALNLSLMASLSSPSPSLDSIVSKRRGITVPSPSSSARNSCVRQSAILTCNYCNGFHDYGFRTGNWDRLKQLSVRASCFDLPQEPILREALKEPVAFAGGIFAGLLRLDLNEDPLKEWVTRTVEASGITEEEVAEEGLKQDDVDAPQQIEIE